MNVYLHKRWDDDMGYENGDEFVTQKRTGRKIPKCAICDSIWNMRYIVPYDGKKPPGNYCYYCRKKHSLMDVEDAKRYGKIL